MRALLAALAAGTLLGCSGTPPSAPLPPVPSAGSEAPGAPSAAAPGTRAPTPARVDSPLCTDLRELVGLRTAYRGLSGSARRGASDEQAAAAAARLLEAVQGGSDGVLSAELERALRDYAAQRPEDASRDLVLYAEAGRLCPG